MYLLAIRKTSYKLTLNFGRYYALATGPLALKLTRYWMVMGFPASVILSSFTLEPVNLVAINTE